MAGEDVTDYLYPLDITGRAATNKVVNERQTLNPPPPPEEMDGEITFHFIMPFAGPFYRDSVVLKHITTGRTLNRGTDWTVGHKFVGATYETEGTRGGIWGSIMFYDRALAGQVEITEYQNLGGEWTLNENKILEIISNRLADPRTLSFEEVADKPNVFPPLPHDHDITDVTGAKELIESNYDIAAAIRERTQDWLDNPPILFSEYYTRDEVDLLLEASPFETVKQVGNVAGTVSIDCLSADVFRMTATAAVNFTFTNRPSLTTATRYIEIQLTNGGNFPMTFPAGTKWPYGDKVLTTGGIDKLVLALFSDKIDVTPIRSMT